MRFPFFLTFYSQPTDVWRGYIVTGVSINSRLHIAMKTMVGTLAVIIIMSLSSTAAYARNNVKSITAEDLVTKVYGLCRRNARKQSSSEDACLNSISHRRRRTTACGSTVLRGIVSAITE